MDSTRVFGPQHQVMSQSEEFEQDNKITTFIWTLESTFFSKHALWNIKYDILDFLSIKQGTSSLLFNHYFNHESEVKKQTKYLSAQ